MAEENIDLVEIQIQNVRMMLDNEIAKNELAMKAFSADLNTEILKAIETAKHPCEFTVDETRNIRELLQSTKDLGGGNFSKGRILEHDNHKTVHEMRNGKSKVMTAWLLGISALILGSTWNLLGGFIQWMMRGAGS